MKKILLFVLLISNISLAQNFLALVNDTNRFGYINTNGEYVIEPQFKEAKSFSSNGLAPAYDGKRWGYINTKGEWAIQPMYTYAKNFHSGYAIVEADKKWVYIDIKGNPLKTPDTDKFYDFNEYGVAFIRRGHQIGLINTQGEIILKPRFNIIRSFNNKYARVRSIEKWGIIDTSGSIVVEPEYDEIGHYYNGVVSARKGEQFGLITDGKFNVVEGATKILHFEGEGELAAARKKNRFGFINKKGEWIIEPTFKKVKAFYFGLAPALGKGGWGFINPKGEWVVQPQFDEVQTFGKEGIAAFEEDRLWGFINKDGNKITRPIYDRPFIVPTGGIPSTAFFAFNKSAYINGFTRVKFRGKWGYLDPKTRLLANKWFKYAENFVEINNNEL